MGVDDWIAREGRTCPRCKSEDCRRWESQQAGKVLPDWKQKEMDDDCTFTANACPTCKGKCCRDIDYGNRVYHMGAECYEHWCDDCRDGQVPAAQPDPRDALIAELRAEVEEHRKAQAAVYLALGTDETDRTKWPEQIKAMRESIAALPPTVFPEWAKARAACRRAAGLGED